ncbi:MAG: zinc-dependent metalloprotease [Flavobacteriales bacterium]|jgi:hypothetical protein|nr:zinc-dependent metalloprotease [Flavobacteriales bacterium]
MKKIIFLSLTLSLGIQLQAQEIYQGPLKKITQKEYCGSYDLMEHIDKKNPSFIEKSNKVLTSIPQGDVQLKSSANQYIYTIPVVFHVVYNNAEENLPDSVIHNQLKILNKAYSRTNTTAANTRSEFLNYVGDTKIRFELATTDPNGNPTNGINRVSTSITEFGGTMPYALNQTAEIINWVNDSLFHNIARITQTSKGGSDPWNPEKYLNLYSGDIRILEPQINNTREIFLLGIATPPLFHSNFPSDILDQLGGFNQAALVHFAGIGSNNPVGFEAPYNIYNTTAGEGLAAVHEVGHYLGLRHIWGDGNCSADDYVDDTPLMSANSQFDCSHTKNSCVDTLFGVDFPDMVENYMDYSSQTCQNAFSKGQGLIMRHTLDNYRTQLATKTIDPIGLDEWESTFDIYPNPSNGTIHIESQNLELKNTFVKITNLQGQTLLLKEMNAQKTTIELPETNGLYLIHVFNQNRKNTYKVLKI